jgi:hypothetical protein
MRMAEQRAEPPSVGPADLVFKLAVELTDQCPKPGRAVLLLERNFDASST